jgi:hypothetical protein
MTKEILGTSQYLLEAKVVKLLPHCVALNSIISSGLVMKNTLAKSCLK